jgi:hypothetical protein
VVRLAKAALELPEQVRTAFAIAFWPRYAYLVCAAGALAMGALLVWSGGFLVQYATVGWEFDASPMESATIIVLSSLFGALLSLEVAAVAKARSVAGSTGGILGTLFGVLSMSCCAPLIAPALLSFVGFSGMTVLQVNIAAHEWALPLTIGSIGFMVLAIVLVSKTITAACVIPPTPQPR